MPVIRHGEGVPDGGEDDLGRWSVLRLGDAGGLTQFGVVIETLAPGSRSSRPHWHAAEDEFVLLLEGAVVLIEGEAEHALAPGDAACFPAGAPVAHCLENRSAADARYLIVGARAAADVVTYPRHDRVLHRDADGTRRFTTTDGTPADPPTG